MRFTKEYLTIIDSLDEPESVAFIAFLESEILRHRDDIAEARQRIRETRRHIKALNDVLSDETSEKGNKYSTKGK